ncbi:fimbria/pilus outer membrane usher protein [Sphingomonas aracearum]|uniref:Fimbrial biogenesis outer membrane usher protein n=1 Tax=Sphingomonas aracearum TaxID=2283317 RepID=A0A369VYC3_9SPHN|nr:fimbria/pilus outer membrane usher protein [Sphingomonas aracearum]RDE07133.1 fimbrial biogenesis outer membrane usher protein [Sphingomonas aracearum]
MAGAWSFLLVRSRRDELAFGFLAAACWLPLAAQAQQRGTVSVGVAVDPDATPQALQLEVYLNGAPTGYVASFNRRADGTFTSPAIELQTVGVTLPEGTTESEVPLNRIPGLRYSYDEAAQIMRLVAGPTLDRPTVIDGRQGGAAQRLAPSRPPLGAVIDYTFFASADNGPGGARFGGVSGALGLRVFGGFGLVENTAIAVAEGGGLRTTRLSSTYSYEDAGRLLTFRAGDVINGGLAWSRPIRMAGLQLQRTFGVRPDLVTTPVPRLSGSAATPSMLDLYIDGVKTLLADVPSGPYSIAHPPIIQGAGQATVVVRDALGRETVSTTAFYASPQLLARGLTDFSAELGFARRSYALRSNDYDRRMIVSGSMRRGLSDRVTVQGHVEAGAGLALLGGGSAVNVADVALVSVAGAVSRAGGHGGGLIDVGLETRRPGVAVLLRSMRTVGRYEDLASRTASFGPVFAVDRRIFGAPREVDQFSLSVPIPRSSASVGMSLVNSRTASGERYRLGNLSATASAGPLSLFASAIANLEAGGSFGLFVGASMPLGGRTTATVGGTLSNGRVSGYAELSRQGAHEPGSWGWSLRATDGSEREAHAIVRHSTTFASFEATALYAGGTASGTFQAEGSVAWVGGGLHASRRLDQSFAVVDAGAAGVQVYRENRLVGTTGRSGRLLVPDLAPFESSSISIDPTSLPVDARIESTHAEAAAFSRVPVAVKFGVSERSDMALVQLLGPSGAPLELGSVVSREGQPDDVVGYDGAAFLGSLRARNEVIVTDPAGGRCRASFPFSPRKGEQVRITATCAPIAGTAP